ncbi:MAG: pyridoxal-phosphate dependent enzyme [Ignavibacteriae bacterium]|nr:pyridoxal-phosphate dependent enzyme [Ignavibacteriota bacterium]
MKIPKKISLANIPTPFSEIQFNGNKFFIKRDDLTGVELTGNKVRKLEYLLYDAKIKKADYVFTRGGDQSNHARATCISAASIGIKSKLFLWGNSNQKPDGNLFLDKFVGAEIKFLNKKEYNSVDQIMLDDQTEYSKKKLKTYIIPSGGSSPLGIWGYINFVSELAGQTNLKKFNGIVTATGSSGTAAGILVGQTLLGLNFKIFGISVIDKKEIVKEDIIKLAEENIKEFDLKIKPNYNNLEILDNYSEEGYKNISQNKINLFKEFFIQTGILLDPTYTGKAFFAYNDNFVNAKNNKVIFLHTGGIFGVFPKRKNYLG